MNWIPEKIIEKAKPVTCKWFPIPLSFFFVEPLKGHMEQHYVETHAP